MKALSPRLPATSPGRWLYALKPASWPKLFVPAFFGQVLGIDPAVGLDVRAVGLGLAFTVLGTGFIVLLNDWGDRDVDAIKRDMFPDGSSPKTIPDRILDARSVAVGGALSGGAALAVAVAAEGVLGRPFAFEAGLGCMLLFVAYTLPPIKLNYRGGGELLETIGVGAALPAFNAYLQAGALGGRLGPWLAGFTALSLASAVASGLSDEVSDRAGGKRTFASTYGNAAARRLVEVSVVLGGSIWLVASLLRPDWVPPFAAGPAVLLIAWNWVAMRRASPAAVTNAFAAQGAYKRYLHRAIWHSTTVAAVLLWAQSAVS